MWLLCPPASDARTNLLHLTGPLYSVISAAVLVLSFGRLTAAATDVVVLLRRP